MLKVVDEFDDKNGKFKWFFCMEANWNDKTQKWWQIVQECNEENWKCLDRFRDLFVHLEPFQ